MKFCLGILLLQSLALAHGICIDKSTCEKCIRTPGCSWCEQITNFTASSRCQTISKNQAICSADLTLNPKTSLKTETNYTFNTTANELKQIQMRPQLTNAKLRLGESQKINITFRKLVDYPLDLYYLMDFSQSMNDDLQMLKSVGNAIVPNIQATVTDNVQVGFGSFVDKIILPFATNDPNWLKAACLSSDCQKTFGFHHQLSITPDSKKFQQVLNDTKISANIDRPEGGFDALMQIAVCQDIIKWRKESLRVVVLSTDAPSHQALDGALIGLLKPNDMSCHMEKINSGSDVHHYTETVAQDYPSVGQLREVFEQYKIQTIFAVHRDVYDIYKDLPKVLPNAFVEFLANDSSNVVSVIGTSYNAIKSRFSLATPIAPPSVDLKYRVLCPDSPTWAENTLQCNNVSIPEEVVFQFEIKAKSCPTNTTQKDIISIGSNIIPDVVNISIEYLCECDCDRALFSQNECSGQGYLKCGLCDCYDGRGGSVCQCETDRSISELTEQCTDTQPLLSGGDISLCHGRGKCDCGKCVCESGFSGKFCECTNIGCPAIDGAVCGGSANGQCSHCYGNQTCVCNDTAGWYQNQGGLCLCNNNLCKATPTDEVLCAGRGECNCHSCSCADTRTWAGTHCNTCVHPSCSNIEGTCANTKLTECARCVYGTQGTTLCQEQCQDIGVNFIRLGSRPNCTVCEDFHMDAGCRACRKNDEVAFTPVDCDTEDSNGCKIKYKITWNKDENGFFLFVQNRYADDCPVFDYLQVVIPAVAGLIVIGIISLLVWKFLKNRWDRREWEKFQSELDQQKWTKGNNPLHEAPTTRVENPRFIERDEDEPLYQNP